MRLREFLCLLPILALLLGVPTMFLVGCTEKPATVKQKPPADDDDDDNDGDDDDDGTQDDDDDSSPFDLCQGLKGHDDLMDDFSDFVKVLCDEKVMTSTNGGLRDPERIYTGGSSAKIYMGSEEENGNESYLRMYTSMLVPTKPESYFNMLRLQLLENDKFENDAGFEVDTEVTYTKEGGSESKGYVEYRYERKPSVEEQVDYKARTDFYVIKKGVAYVTATQHDEDYEKNGADTLLKLKGMVIVNEAGSKTEVFTMSDQTYDNSTDHETTTGRARLNLEAEQIRTYKNGKDADKADEYFD